MTSLRRQSGATLVIVLIMLTILTLFAISAVNLSNANLRVVGNLQARKQVEAVGQQAAENVMSSMGYFSGPTNNYILTSGTITAKASTRVCQYATAASGYSAVQPIVPEDTQWDFGIQVEDSFSNAKATFWQGTKIRMLSGNCPLNLTHTFPP